ncbi:asparaginyl/glutamyl-tRNA amidotransferase subunit C [Helicobacter enhydrae]|uniref:Aspartyl/glutamyl-tRNA(Asn/Gln) amidotransferase subunit C n=2 Tax=Helicobacter enhydrae TaxID=222136 RepID=A0A1B1U5E2_9HELI|nr:asparaginyl/glutamyl-tRNA amidotransferase subunit C [Helicobacter enhydrae]
MKIDDVLLGKLEKLGMIEIAQDQKEDTKKQLSEIVGFMDNLGALDLDDIVLDNDLQTPMREDVVRDGGVRDMVLSTAPNAKDGFFIVPKIIE